MKLSTLIQKKETATATIATPATHIHPQRGNCSESSKCNRSNQLFAEEETAIRDWLAQIEETDPVIITEVMDQCRGDPRARQFFIKYSQKT